MKKDQRGITLIALVITIIVLLILAGVSIAMLSGEDGILNKSVKAADATTLETAREQAGMAVNSAMADYYQAKYVDRDSDAISQEFGTWVQSYDKWPENHEQYWTISGAKITLVPKGDIDKDGTYDSTIEGDIQTKGGIEWNDGKTTGTSAGTSSAADETSSSAAATESSAE